MGKIDFYLREYKHFTHSSTMDKTEETFVSFMGFGAATVEEISKMLQCGEERVKELIENHPQVKPHFVRGKILWTAS